MSDFLWPNGLQHTRLPCPSPTPEACSNSCQLSQWCHPAISSSVVPFPCLRTFPVSGSFPMSQLFGIRWPNFWNFSFSISPSNEYSGLISFRINWFDVAVQGTKASILRHSAFFFFFSFLFFFFFFYNWRDLAASSSSHMWPAIIFYMVRLFFFFSFLFL